MKGRIPAASIEHNVSVGLGCFGCAWSIFGLILLVFVVTHVSEIFAKLGALVK